MPQLDRLLGPANRRSPTGDMRAPQRGAATHLVILYGSMSSLASGQEPNVGLAFRLLHKAGLPANRTLCHEASIR
jgi:hypothetical protein